MPSMIGMSILHILFVMELLLERVRLAKRGMVVERGRPVPIVKLGEPQVSLCIAANPVSLCIAAGSRSCETVAR